MAIAVVQPKWRLQNCCMHGCVDWLPWCERRYFSQYSCLALWFVGGRKRDAVEATCTKLTLERTDMGKGQVAAALSNFRSLAAIFGPPIAARIYTYGLSIGNPGIACKYKHRQ